MLYKTTASSWPPFPVLFPAPTPSLLPLGALTCPVSGWAASWATRPPRSSLRGGNSSTARQRAAQRRLALPLLDRGAGGTARHPGMAPAGARIEAGRCAGAPDRGRRAAPAPLPARPAAGGPRRTALRLDSGGEARRTALGHRAVNQVECLRRGHCLAAPGAP